MIFRKYSISKSNHMKTIWYIHGAGASQNSFNWLRTHLPEHTAKFINYTTTDKAETTIARLLEAVSSETDPVTLIGHSCGGIIARACAGRTARVERLVTLCSPFGGVKYAALASLFIDAPMLRELRTYSSLLFDVRTVPIAAPHLAIVATKGLPVHSECNDGVITLASATALPNQKFFEFALNHFEVLLSADVAGIIGNFLEDK
jgi:pimeloyl-ACP methyl ester carboxylesterase